MAKYLRYYTEFTSVEGHTVRAEIFQESPTAFTPVELEIGSVDSPLTIEWAETDKIEPIQGSTATLVVNSSSDRQLLHLAGVVAGGEVRLDVYRDNALWWSGTLDSEGYEEPYTSAANYDVALTFSDFGVLNRIPWRRTGVESYQAVLNACISASGLAGLSVCYFISTRHGDNISPGPDVDFTAITLNNDNFYDEDSEAMTCFEVLAGILQPFALRIVQRAGEIFIYDLNAASARAATSVNWKGDDAMITHDKVFNNATVTFSPYGDDCIVSGSVKEIVKSNGPYTIKTDLNAGSPPGFDLLWGTEAEGAVLENGARFFKIEPGYSGSDASGILWSFYRGDKPMSEPGNIGHMLNMPASCFSPYDNTNNFVGQRIATFPPQYINHVPAGAIRTQHKLRINLDLLFDVRYNPFEEAGDDNEKSNYATMESKCGFVWVPVMVTLRNAPGGTALWHLENRGTALGTGISTTEGVRWVSGAGTPGCFFLAYYNYDDRISKTGVGGWAKNRQCIGYYTKGLPSAWAVMDAGEYVPLPPVGGYIEMAVYSGFHIRNRDIVHTIYDKIRWVGYKDAQITLVKNNGLKVELSDQEDIAYINAATKEKYSLDTILGTLPDDVPMAIGKGIMIRGTTRCGKFHRAGRTDRLELLLLGTIYSQYAERKLKLSGTIGLTSGIVLADSPRIEGKFIMVADTQDIRDDTSNIIMTQFGPDEYTGHIYE